MEYELTSTRDTSGKDGLRKIKSGDCVCGFAIDNKALLVEKHTCRCGGR